ncbi:MAG TPA: hypothetical protein VM243_03400 [Phycisphaerae bacterium]|nr:hypothetical protein [Phycisphaerae bacterium]
MVRKVSRNPSVAKPASALPFTAWPPDIGDWSGTGWFTALSSLATAPGMPDGVEGEAAAVVAVATTVLPTCW